MRMKKFSFCNALSLQEVWEILEQYGEGAKLIAGGTDLVVQMKSKLISPEVVINLLPLKELKGIEKKDGFIRIGALVTHATLEISPLLRPKWMVLAEAAHKVGSPQIRNWGTIGGNLVNASPAADSAPALLVLEGEVVLVSKRGERQIPLDSFFLGPGLTILEKDEVLKEILVPLPPENSVSTFLKLGRRKSLDLAIVNVAVLLHLAPATNYCLEARIALGAVSPTPIRIRKTEEFLTGKILKEEIIREAGWRAQEECQPISDIRASASYRQEMVKIMVERAIKKSLGLPIPPTGIQ